MSSPPKEKGTIIRLTEVRGVTVIVAVCTFSTTQDISKDFSFRDELGHGQFGVTRLVEHRTTKEKYACKSILKRVLRCGVIQ